MSSFVIGKARKNMENQLVNYITTNSMQDQVGEKVELEICAIVEVNEISCDHDANYLAPFSDLV